MSSAGVGVFFSRDRFFHERVVQLSLGLSVLANLAAWGIVAWRIREATELIPLHYTIYFSIDYIGPWAQFWGLPAFGAGVLLLNTLIGARLYQSQRLLSLLLMPTTLLLEGLVAWAVYLIATLP